MGPDAHHARATAAVGARLGVLEEEIDAPIRPIHVSVAARKLTTTTDPILDPVKEIVELPQVGEPFRHEPALPRIHTRLRDGISLR